MWSLEGRRGRPPLLSPGGQGQEDYFYEQCRHFLERDLLSTCWPKHSWHSCTVLLSSHSPRYSLGYGSLALASGSFSATCVLLTLVGSQIHYSN